jgi:hypothetical protein
MTKTKRRFGILVGALVALVLVGYFGFGYAISRTLEAKGIRKLISANTGRMLNCDAGYLPLRSHGLFVSCPGFLAQASPPRALTEMRASNLRADCKLQELWRAKWKIENLTIAHLQAAYGAAAAQHLNRDEFRTPELLAPSKTESPLKIDIRRLDVAHLDLFWGTTPEAEGEFRDVHTQFFPRDHNLVVHGDGGTFRQAKFPAVRLQQVKLFYAKPDLRVDEAILNLGGEGTINVAGNFRFEDQQACDLQVTFAHCPIGPFLSEEQRDKLEGVFDGNTRLQKDRTQTKSARAVGTVTISKAILKNIETLQNVATFTGRKELARMSIQQVKGDYDWNSPRLTVKNFLLESNELLVLEGEFVLQEKKINGEFQLGISPDVVDKFPGAREEVFKRSERGYLWTDLSLTGTIDHPRENLKPRLVRAAQNHFAKGLLAPLFKPGQTVIQAIEAL